MFYKDFLLETQVLLKLPKVHAQRTHGRNSWGQLERRRLEADDDAEGVLVVDFGCLCVAADTIFIGFPGHLLKQIES